MTSSKEENDDCYNYGTDPVLTESDFCDRVAEVPLRVCCYGSSSAKTPSKFKKEAFHLGYILAKRGHTCVNGAGSFGCMAAMNDGAEAGNGHIVGVIHEMFLVDGSDWSSQRDGGAHRIFSPGHHHHQQQNEKAKETRNMDNNNGGEGRPVREILVAGGGDLQERKRLLVDGADALVVLPGGPGTWDELWEMACARNLGLTRLPIVCVSVDNFYDNFEQMLQRAHREGLVKNPPDKIVHFVPTAEEAVRWIERQKEVAATEEEIPRVTTRSSVIRGTESGSQSFLAPPRLSNNNSRSFSKSCSTTSSSGEEGESSKQPLSSWTWTAAIPSFLAGTAVGLIAATQFQIRR